MSCPVYITALSQQIFNDLGQPSDQPIAFIQSKLVSPSYAGQLGTLTSDCIISVSGVLDPELDDAQQAIYRMMYERDYYTTKLNQTLAGLAPGNGVLEMSDGDSRMRFVNPVEMAKVYKEMQRQLNEQLQLVISSYRINQALPRDVQYPLIWNVIGGGGGGYGYNNSPIAGGPHTYYRS